MILGKEGGGGSSLSGSDVTATNSTTQDGGLMIELNEAEDHLNDIADGRSNQIIFSLWSPFCV